ncbi:MAG: hypothetical protein ABSB79_08125 [Syntrophales bacterium]
MKKLTVLFVTALMLVGVSTCFAGSAKVNAKEAIPVKTFITLTDAYFDALDDLYSIVVKKPIDMHEYKRADAKCTAIREKYDRYAQWPDGESKQEDLFMSMACLNLDMNKATITGDVTGISDSKHELYKKYKEYEKAHGIKKK